MTYRTAEQLEAGMARVYESPREEGEVRLVVRRPGRGEREILSQGQLDTERGLIGDDWINRPGMHRDTPSPYSQVTVMNARAAALFSDSSEHVDWAPAGDQLYVDLDLSQDNIPAGTRLAVGDAVLERRAPVLGEDGVDVAAGRPRLELRPQAIEERGLFVDGEHASEGDGVAERDRVHAGAGAEVHYGLGAAQTEQLHQLGRRQLDEPLRVLEPVRVRWVELLGHAPVGSATSRSGRT